MLDDMKLSQATDRYLVWRRSQGYAKNTVRNDKSALKQLAEVVGDPLLESIDRQDMDRVFDRLSATRAPSSINAAQASYSAFFRWARTFRLAGPDFDPLLGFRYRRVPRRERPRFALAEFPAVLDAAPEPRIRAMLACGLFMFLRASEVTTLRIGDVSLDDARISTVIHKTGDHDDMPIPAELDAELRRWLTTYTEEVGPLQSDYYLIPARIQAGFGTHRLNPRAKVSRPQELVKRAFEAYGVDQRGESFHRLRRSGARALFDELVDEGIDGALEIVQTQLHHASVTMTERYLGITHSRAKRDQLLRGETMFKSLAADNVVPLKSVAG